MMMDSQTAGRESSQPLGTLVFNLLVEGCNKLLAGASKGMGMSMGGGMSGSKGDQSSNAIELAERAANLLAAVFVHGSQLAKELSTAINTSHTAVVLCTATQSHSGPQPLLPLMLATASSMARVPGGGGYALLRAVLRMLSAIVAGCERATNQLMEDPANLFVVDLATIGSESAGVPLPKMT